MPSNVPPPGPEAPDPNAAVPAASPVAVDEAQLNPTPADPASTPHQRDSGSAPSASEPPASEPPAPDAPPPDAAAPDGAAPEPPAPDAPPRETPAPVVPASEPLAPLVGVPAATTVTPGVVASPVLPGGPAIAAGTAPASPHLAPPPTRAELRRSRRSHRSLAHRTIVWAVILVVLAALAGAGAVAHARLYAAPPKSAVMLSVAPEGPVIDPGGRAAATAPLPWPVTGQAAVAIPSIGYAAQSGPELPVPVASMTKIMTGYLILRDHPLVPGQNGPNITITPSDVTYYVQDTVSDQANVPVQVGEVLTERQMLEGLLVHSANDFAYSLAAWDAGSLPAFVAKMNATAQQLGMAGTHYVDPSGYLPQSQSTAADLLKVATVALRDPTFASIVTMSSVSLPLGGVEGSYTPLLPGEPGGNPAVVGVKSGFTDAAGGGDVLALKQNVGGHSVIVLAAVTGQETADVLATAGLAAFILAQAAGSRVVVTSTLPIGTVVGTAQVLGKSVPAVTTGTGSLVAWPGERLRQATITVGHPYAGASAGTPLGYVTYSIGTQRLAALVRTTAMLPARTPIQRLF